MSGELFRLNWSTLKYIAISPALMRWRVEHPQPDTPALKFGRALHCKILEPEFFDQRWLTAGFCPAAKKSGEVCGYAGTLYLDGAWYCRTKGHAPAGAGPLPDGCEFISDEERRTIALMVERLAAHDVATSTLSAGRREEALEWTHSSGIACKGRLDFLRADYVVDLKTSCTETAREFRADAARRLYHGQLAWYHDGAIAAGRIPKDAEPPRIVCIETGEPYDVAVYQFTDMDLAAGRCCYRELLQRYADCLAADYWPGHSPDLQAFDLPEWAEGMRAAEATA